MPDPVVTVSVQLTNYASVTVTLPASSSKIDAKQLIMSWQSLGGFFDDAGVWHSASTILAATPTVT